MVSTTRPINWRTEPSRSEVPGLPWKYLLATILVAVCDQFFGTSTFSCLKIVAPFSLPIRAVRFSHSTLSKGDTFPSVKKRSKTRPVDTVEVSTDFEVSTALPFSACFTVAILIPPRNGFPYCERGNPSILHPRRAGGCVPASETQLDSWPVWKASPRDHRKKRMHCPMPVKFPRPNSKLRAYLRLRGAGTSRSFFAVIPGWSVGQSRTKACPRLGPSGASTSPESGFAVSDYEELVSREN